MVRFYRLVVVALLWAFSVTTANAWGFSSEAQTILAKAHGLNPHVLQLALTAYHKLRAEGYDKQRVLTIVDYSKPSTKRRLWVINLNDLNVPFHELVAQGKNSGLKYATQFSNTPRSLESSIGVYLTGRTYDGEHGYSMRLNGLEKGFNSNARVRDIVMHSAYYVSEQFAHLHGYLGRSWGCFALNPKVATPVIKKIKDGTVLFAYYPDKQWLDHSPYLQA